MRVNAKSWVDATNELPSVERFRRCQDLFHGVCVIDVHDIAKRQRLPGPETWQKGDVAKGEANVFDASGNNLSELFLLSFADDTTPQWPDGVPGVVGLMVTIDGETIPNGRPLVIPQEHRVEVRAWPGIRILRKPS